MKTHIRNRESGFTLIEYIVGLVVVSIIAAMIYNIMGTSLTKSGSPIQNLQKASDLSRVMENIIADYNRLNEINMRYKWRSSNAYRSNSIVLPSTGDDNDASTIKNNGRYYKCTTAGTSSATQPTWPVKSDLTGTVSDGTGAWKEEGRIWLASTTYAVGDIIVPMINNGHYYKCTQAGTSAANEPSSKNSTPNPWPTANNGTVTDGGVIWTEAGTILYSADTTNTILKDNLKYYLTTTPGRYGTGYTVVSTETKFIQFNASTQAEENASSENNILKVTIKANNSGQYADGNFYHSLNVEIIMNIKKTDERGFTLIELIVTLVLVGISAAMAGMWISSVAQGYFYAKTGMDTTQKAQLAMTRLSKELAAISAVTASSSSSITYDRPTSPTTADLTGQTVSLNGNLLQLNGNTLTDNVNAFTLKYYNDATDATGSNSWSSTSRIIEITLKLNGANNIVSTFTQRVAPRNL